MSRAEQLGIAESCAQCGRPVRLLSSGARFLLMQMRFAAQVPPPPAAAADMRERARELEEREPGTAAAVACHLGLCRRPLPGGSL